MKNLDRWIKIGLALSVFLLGWMGEGAITISSADQYPGNAKMVAGELWESFFPQHITPPYDGRRKGNALVSLGNIDRAWSTPTGGQYPGGYNHWFDWYQYIYMCEYNPDVEDFNQGDNAGDDKHYMPVKYYPGLQDPNGVLYPTSPFDDDALHRWVDECNTQMYYKAGWPTNAGVDVVMELRQYTQNWQNFNDFIIVSLTLTNTGNVDSDGDGTYEITDNRIRALTISTVSEVVNSTGYNVKTGRRGGSDWGGSRRGGYDGTAKCTVEYPAAWTIDSRDFGMNKHNQHRAYTESWKGWAPIAVKQGVSAGPDAPDKKTLFDSDPLGLDDPAGPFFSMTNGQGGLLSDPKTSHGTTMGVWYANGGRSKLAASTDYSPDPNYFESGTRGDIFSFVPKAEGSRGRPQGDTKAYSDDPDGKGHGWEGYNVEPTWTDGYSGQYNFDGYQVMGMGPFSLEVGESVTVIFAECGGFRLKGLRQSVAAARAAFANNYEVPKPPPAPLMKVRPTADGKIEVLWNDNAEGVADPDLGTADFAGYKIYKSRAFPVFNSLEDGMVWMNNGQVNPLFAKKVDGEWELQSEYLKTWVRKQEGGQWGPYHEQINIPAASKGNYALASSDPEYANGFRYVWKDEALDVNLGFTYWHSVAAYDEGGSVWTGVIPNLNYDDNADVPVNMNAAWTGALPALESGHWNWNGRDGKWHGTFPEATLHNEFTDALGSGSPFVLTTPAPTPADVTAGKAKIGVKPNPYKKKALFDVGVEHKIMFYNLPETCTITIYDVAGQLLDTIEFRAPDPLNGTYMWDMYTNDGIEIASGLYIYLVEYTGGEHLGHFAVLR